MNKDSNTNPNDNYTSINQPKINDIINLPNKNDYTINLPRNKNQDTITNTNDNDQSMNRPKIDDMINLPQNSINLPNKNDFTIN